MNSQLRCDLKKLVCLCFNLIAFQPNEVDATIYKLLNSRYMANSEKLAF